MRVGQPSGSVACGIAADREKPGDRKVLTLRSLCTSSPPSVPGKPETSVTYALQEAAHDRIAGKQRAGALRSELPLGTPSKLNTVPKAGGVSQNQDV